MATVKKNMKTSALILACSFLGSLAGAERYRVQDEGGFASTGRHIEFASRYGWEAYAVDYKLDFDPVERRLHPQSKLTITVTRSDGSRWSHSCKAKDETRMWANVNKLYGKGLSVLTECRIPPKNFAKAVGLDADLVGEPTVVFHVMIKDGKAVPGVQKGIYFEKAGQIEASTMIHYASAEADPSELGVLFRSRASARLSGTDFAMAFSR